MGVARRIGRDMAYRIIPISGKSISETTVQHVTCDDMIDPDIAAQITLFYQALPERLENTNFIIDDLHGFGVEHEGSDMTQWDTCDKAYGDNNTNPTETEYGKIMEEPHPNVDNIGSFNKHIGVTVKINDENNSGVNIDTVKRRATDANGFAIGQAHNNPLLDTRNYEVELEDGTTDSYFANFVAYNMYSKLDSKGHQHLVMSEIVYPQRYGSVGTNENGYICKHYNIPNKTTRGWEVLIEWNYETTAWVHIRYVNEANP